ncbi:MAG: ABC transporter permease subunit [Dehalococcoidia bacterium]|nr:ABC transporter permease subunit [Dehalococcoidia bacterium]
MRRILKAPVLGQVVVAAIILLALEAITRAGLVSPLSLARPSASAVSLWTDITDGSLGGALATTSYEILVAFLIASFLGVSLGYLLWRFQTAGRAAESLLASVFSTPTVLLFPIILVIFGRSPAVPISMAVLVGFIPITINVRAGLANVRGTFLKLGRSLSFTNRQIFTKLMLPAAAPMIFSGLKLGLIYTMIGVTAIEFLVEIGGLGKEISMSYTTFDTPNMYAYLAMVLLVAIVLVEVVNRAEARIR